MSAEIVDHKPPVETPRNDDGIHDSEEYESAEEVEEGEGDGEGEVYEDEDVDEVEVEVEEEEEEEGSVKEKVLDGDEDRKNPQFIPKKGYFYEHDDRINAPEEEEGAEGEDAAEEPKKEEPKPKKVVKDAGDRWSHDLYDEDEQGPKTGEELSSRYGYDIRGDPNAPRARRRRKYGRGPNSYTPNWDEEGRGRGGYRGRDNNRGSFRGRGADYRNNERHGSRDGGNFDEKEFPELPRSDRAKDNVRQDSGAWARKNDQRENRNSSGREYGNQNPDRESSDNRDNRESRSGGSNSSGSYRGQGYRGNDSRGRGNDNRGRGADSRGRGRGRRNQFTNSFRYGDRRNSSETEGDRQQNINTDQMRTSKPQPHLNGSSERNVATPASVVSPKNSQTGSGTGQATATSSPVVKPPQPSPQPQPPRKSTLPFTNTEYTGSASLTASRNQGQGHSKKEEARSPLTQRNYEDEHDDRASSGRPRFSERDDRSGRASGPGMGPDREERRREQQTDRASQDARESRYNNNSYQNDRRSQMPPRLQQQQQQQQSPAMSPGLAPKPKRFSTQRQQRPTLEQNMANLSVSSPPLLNQPMGPAGVNVQGAGSVPQQMVSSTVSVPPPVMSAYVNHPPPPTYYEQVPTSYDQQQIYEATGTPITVSGANLPHVPGSTVSPALWGPLSSAYVTAPYPSPPGQVPQPPYGDPAFIATAQNPGNPIYAAPHPHPQFIQDPTLISYPPTGPPPTFVAPPFHPAGYQGFPQVAPPHPEMYGGVTYYNTQNQMPRPHIPAPSKRPKSMLQLVEPPEKKDVGRNRSPRLPVTTDDHYQYAESHQDQQDEQVAPQQEVQPAPSNEQSSYDDPSSVSKENLRPAVESKLADDADTRVSEEASHIEKCSINPPPPESDAKLLAPLAASEELEPEQSKDQSAVNLQIAETKRSRKSPSPAPLELTEEKTWSEQMSDSTPINSPAADQEVPKEQTLLEIKADVVLPVLQSNSELKTETSSSSPSSDAIKPELEASESKVE